MTCDFLYSSLKYAVEFVLKFHDFVNLDFFFKTDLQNFSANLKTLIFAKERKRIVCFRIRERFGVFSIYILTPLTYSISNWHLQYLILK